MVSTRPEAHRRGVYRDPSRAGEPLPHPAVKEIELAAVLHALSDPMRLKIVAGLAAGGPRTCKSFDLPVTKSTCTHHFRVLREAGVIRQRLEGTTRLSWLRREDLEQRFPGLIESVSEPRWARAPGARLGRGPGPMARVVRRAVLVERLHALA